METIPPTPPNVLDWKLGNAPGTVYEAFSPIVIDSKRCRWRICRRMKDGEEWVANHDEGLPIDTRTWPSMGMAMAAVLAAHCEVMRTGRDATGEVALRLLQHVEDTADECSRIATERDQLQERVEALETEKREWMAFVDQHAETVTPEEMGRLVAIAGEVHEHRTQFMDGASVDLSNVLHRIELLQIRLCKLKYPLQKVEAGAVDRKKDDPPQPITDWRTEGFTDR